VRLKSLPLGAKGRTLGKGFRIKWGDIGNTLGKCHGNMRNIIGNVRIKKFHPLTTSPPPAKGKKMNTLGCTCSVISLVACIFYS
jgi:hypothetical protein